jgi:maleamate amidohydrolase
MEETRMNDALRKWSGEPVTIGFGDKPAVVVVDFQNGFTRDPDFLMDGAPLIDRAIANTARLLDVARAFGVPVATCYTAYKSERDMPYWKLTKMRELLIHGHPATELDSRIYDPDYDLVVCKTGASIFFQTPVVNYLIKERVDTVIVTGCVTSACVRASIVDSFQYKFRTIVPEDCVGDREADSHHSNLRDVGRRYCDVSTSEAVIDWLENWHEHAAELPRANR